jgi:hypothetical protein
MATGDVALSSRSRSLWGKIVVPAAPPPVSGNDYCGNFVDARETVRHIFGASTRRVVIMAFEAIKAEIRALLEGSIDEPQDAHEMHLQLIERLNEMRATGMPLPDDLVELERRLTESFDTLPDAE